MYQMIVSEKVILTTRPFPGSPNSPRPVYTLLRRTTGSDRPYLTPPLSIRDCQCLIDAIKTISLKSSPRFPLFLHMLATQGPPPKVIFSTKIEMPECVCLMRGSGGPTRCTACFHPQISFSFRKGQHRKWLESPRKGKQWILVYRPDQGSFRGIPSENGFERRSKLQICNW
jgi:hypothetical protein